MTRLAVVQPALKLGDVESNLRHVEDLVRDAHREHHADAILLPEALSTPNVYAKVLRSTPFPIKGPAFQLLSGLARGLGCVIGGGFVAVRGAHTYGTYVLAEPDGSAHLHDKDTPTAWEHNYYRGGNDDGVIRCAALDATVGLMSGWEWARYETSRRQRAGGAQLVLGGMCWPSMPTNWPGPLDRWFAHQHAEWKRQQAALPGQVARLVGAPVAHAAHVGPIVGETPLAPGLRWPTTMIGESQICDRDGTILARLAEEDGEGHVSAEVSIAAPQPLDPLDDRRWIPDASLILHKGVGWFALNAHGDVHYRMRHATRRFPWQRLPADDVPDEIPASDPAGPVATPL
jgi:predicted amidohydrolase